MWLFLTPPKTHILTTAQENSGGEYCLVTVNLYIHIHPVTSLSLKPVYQNWERMQHLGGHETSTNFRGMYKHTTPDHRFAILGVYSA